MYLQLLFVQKTEISGFYEKLQTDIKKINKNL